MPQSKRKNSATTRKTSRRKKKSPTAAAVLAWMQVDPGRALTYAATAFWRRAKSDADADPTVIALAEITLALSAADIHDLDKKHGPLSWARSQPPPVSGSLSPFLKSADELGRRFVRWLEKVTDAWGWSQGMLDTQKAANRLADAADIYFVSIAAELTRLLGASRARRMTDEDCRVSLGRILMRSKWTTSSLASVLLRAAGVNESVARRVVKQRH